ncbi:ADP-ribosylation/crystallin J1 [Foetidibacter luteolus]|uniref:ADP-ribosylation/crystallin J1 n=1 Tax=Foetidibacter luteolus TaxID=2608880 RepID=UPI00129BFBA0|nr:ADP-ribosylation/crystallin J1 [Foetidibacter luteolus]
MNLVKLYRPVGEKELGLIRKSGFAKFPPRLEWQPIFYPVLNEAYASQIALEWNTRDAFSGFAGHVLCFQVPEDYFLQFPIQNVGGNIHEELWIPVEELENFNNHIVGKIEIITSYYGEEYEK